MTRNQFLTIAAPLILLSATGCAPGRAHGASTLTQWQRDVETYTRQRGNGDPSILRDAAPASNPNTFASLGGQDPSRSTDIVGLLVGAPSESETQVLYFMVATVTNSKVMDIRLVALYGAGAEGLKWRVGELNPPALKTYRTRHTGDTPPVFPARDAAFTLRQDPDSITVTESTSGASWTLSHN